MDTQLWTPGERFERDRDMEDNAPGKHVWRTLGYRRVVWEPGRQVVEWDAGEEYCFPTRWGHHLVHGGMTTTLLDTAMGGACWTLLNDDEVFLTADLRTEFLRPTRPGLLRADGRVVQKTQRVVFCAADMFDTEGRLLATARCTQVVLPARREEDNGG